MQNNEELRVQEIETEPDDCACSNERLSGELIRLREFYRIKGIPVMEDFALKLLCERLADLRPEKVLEIGTATGCSGIAILMSAGKSCRLTTVEIDEDSFYEAAENFRRLGLYGKVHMILGDAAEVLQKMSGKYDYIFLDGPKGHYHEYYPYLKELLKEGGEMFCDDVLIKEGSEGRKFNAIKNNMRTFIGEVKADNEMQSELIRKGNGIMIVKKRGNR